MHHPNATSRRNILKMLSAAPMLPLTTGFAGSALLAGCGTPTHQDVGAVVVAPKPKLLPPPELVQKTEQKPVGYFQQTLVDFFGSSPEKPTTLTSPTPAAVQTPTQ